MKSPNLRLGILFIGTGKYINLFDGFFESFTRHWCPDIKKRYFVFSDTKPNIVNSTIEWLPTPFEPWPHPTLNRYDYFLRYADHLGTQTHLVFANANLRPVVDIEFSELFDEQNTLFGVKHPGFAFIKRRLLQPYPGTFESNKRSTAYVVRPEQLASR